MMVTQELGDEETVLETTMCSSAKLETSTANLDLKGGLYSRPSALQKEYQSRTELK